MSPFEATGAAALFEIGGFEIGGIVGVPVAHAQTSPPFDCADALPAKRNTLRGFDDGVATSRIGNKGCDVPVTSLHPTHGMLFASTGDTPRHPA